MSNVTRIVDVAKKRNKHKSLWSSRWFKVGAIAAGAGLAAGIVLAKRGTGGASSSSTITISPGPPVVGGPH